MMKRILIYSILLYFFIIARGQQREHNYKLIAPDRIESKNYYFTYLLGYFHDVDSLLQTNTTLKQMAIEKRQKLIQASTYEERIAAFKFTEEEIHKAGLAFAQLYHKGNPLDKLLKTQIIPSGCYGQYTEEGSELIKKIWRQDAEGINYAIEVYGSGRHPNYPQIDSIYFNVKSSRYTKEILPGCQRNVLLETEPASRFYSIPIAAVRTLLDVNECAQASDYEPMGKGVNSLAYSKIKQTVWDDYPYSAILVLGAGPESKSESISPEGKIRAEYAAIYYHRRQAPFIIVSGGKVHPYHTPYCEAEEMKRYLMKCWDVPESAIIMEPHARHTTTNIRNSGRILWREGFPMDKAALITSSSSHIDYIINGNGFKQRFLKELKTIPYRLGKRISDGAIEYYPLVSTLIINPLEPLDP